ncbi:MAG: sigma factor [Victivallaceae bacterium]|nr:sigma factor [Victivallaceae bacterium]
MGTHAPHNLTEPELFALAEKIIRHRARMLIGLFGFTKHDVPDIQQELFLELYKRKENFDSEKGRESTFIARVVESKVLDLIKQRQAECRDWRQCRESLNRTVTLPDIGVIEKIDTLESEQNSDLLLILDVTLIQERLPPDLQEFCQILKYYDKNEALADYSTSRSVFFRNLQKLKDIFLQAGFDEKFPSKTLPYPV